MKTHLLSMPDLGEGVVEGEVQKWRVRPGDLIQEDDIVAEVTTDKASLEIPSTASGKVKEIKIQEGGTCPVGETLLVLEVKTSSLQKKEEKAPPPPEVILDSRSSSSKKETSKKPATYETVLVAPVVRKWAKEHSIDLSKVQGTGLAGRITLDDVQKIHPPSSKKTMSIHSTFHVDPHEKQERKPLKGVRKKIAENMQASKNTIPHFTLMEEAQFENLYSLRNQAKKLYPDVKITYLSFIMKILQNNLREFPILNASVDDHTNEIVYKKYYHFGFATDTPKGLLVPVVKDVDQKSIVQISREIKELSDKARDGNITIQEMRGATITITNLGSIAGRWATPIINPPEAAILGMYKMVTRPIFDGDQFQPKKTMNFSITADHRIVDGAVAARFLAQFVERIENPSLILIEG